MKRLLDLGSEPIGCKQVSSIRVENKHTGFGEKMSTPKLQDNPTLNKLKTDRKLNPR